ncbi:hypothetical protein T492DRAFT_869190 [Pavlovales sp. CCMP2436]|nr:hypothetical protein T492DRAFT_869190 [Pavlovales sp. CCMP2436]
MKFGKLAHTDFGDWPTVNYKELKRFLSNSTLDAVSSAEFVHELAAMLAEVDDAFVSQETAIIDALAVAAPGRPSSPKERFESVQLHNRRSSVDSMRRSSQEPGLCFGGSNSGAGERLTPTCAVPIGTRVPGSTPPACERFTKSAPLVDAAVWPTGGSPAARTFGGGPATSSLALVIANPHGYDGGRGYGASVAMSAAARTSAEMSQSAVAMKQ